MTDVNLTAGIPVDPNPDGTTATAVLNLYMTNQIIPNCTTIFAGGDIPDKLITDTRARFQDVNKLIAQILAELPTVPA